MRRVGALLALVGLALLIGAALLRFVIGPGAIKAPIEEDGDPYTATSVAVGTASLLDQETGQLVADVPITATRTVTADVDASTDDVAVWDVGVTTVAADGSEISSTSDRVAFDRETSEAVDGFDEAVDGEAVSHDGSISYKFPFDTEQESYDYFDTTTRQAWPAEFQGTEDIDGVETYHFTQTVEPTKIGDVGVPGALLQQPDVPSVTLDRMYNTTREFFVEPTSGVIVRGTEQTQQTLQTPDGSVSVPALDAALEFDEATVADRLEEAEDAKSSIGLVRDTLPLIGVIAGPLLGLLGIWMMRRKPDAAEAAPVTDDYLGQQAPPTPYAEPASAAESAPVTEPSLSAEPTLPMEPEPSAESAPAAKPTPFTKPSSTEPLPADEQRKAP